MILLVLLVALPAFGLIWITAAEVRDLMIEDRRGDALSAARLLANDHGRVVASTEQLMRWIAQFPEVQSGNAEACAARLEQLHATSEGYLGFSISDPSGWVNCLVPRRALTLTLNNRDLPAFVGAVTEKRFYVAPLTRGRVTGRMSLPFGFPILDDSGQVRRVIFAGLDIDTLARDLSRMPIPPGGEAMVLDRTGAVVAHAPDRGQDVLRAARDSGLIQRVMANTSGVAETSGLDGAQRVYAYAPYRVNGTPVLYTVIGYPVSSIYAEANALLSRNIMILTLFALTWIGVAWAAVDLVIIRPTGRIMAAARRLAQGDLTARTGLTYGRSELSTLARDFDGMADALEQRERELDDALARSKRDADYIGRLNRLAARLTPALSRLEVMQATLEEISASIGADAAAVNVVNEDGRSASLVKSYGYSADVITPLLHYSLDDTVPGAHVIRTGEPLWFESHEAFAERYPHLAAQRRQLGIPSSAFVPMSVEGRVIGLLGLSFRQARHFTGQDKDLLLTFANQCALALERERLYDAERQSRERAERSASYLQRLQQVTSALSLSSAFTPPQVTEAILTPLMSSFGADTGAISLMSPDGHALDLAVARGYTPDAVATFERISLDRPVASVEAVLTGQAVWMRTQEEYLQRYPIARSNFVRFDDQASAVVPIMLGEQAIGVIALNFRAPRQFSAEDKDLLLAFSSQCAQTLERARLYQQLQEYNAQLEARVAARTQQLQKANDALLESRERLRELTGRMLTAIEGERERIAREVHDELGQAMTVLKIDIGRARRDLNGANPRVAEYLTSGLATIDESIRTIRRIATELRPGILDDLGLGAALEWQLHEFETRTGITCRLDRRSAWLEVNPECSTAAFRIVQEALTNVARHSKASEVVLSYMADSRRMLIKVQDNGVGMDNVDVNTIKSFGLRGMRERAAQVGAALKVRSAPGHGTAVVLVFPVCRALGIKQGASEPGDIGCSPDETKTTGAER